MSKLILGPLLRGFARILNPWKPADPIPPAIPYVDYRLMEEVEDLKTKLRAKVKKDCGKN